MVYDLIVLGILLIAAVRGAAKGMAWQLAAIASLVLCFLFATPLSLPVAQMIKVDPPLNRWIAMLAVYVVFSLLCFGMARAIRGWLERAKFVEYDRHLGAMFGLLKGAIFCFVMTFFLVCMSDQLSDYIFKTTKTGYVSAVLMQQLKVVMPAEVADVLRPYLRNIPQPELNRGHEGRPQIAGAETEPSDAPRNRYRPKSEFRGASRPQDRPDAHETPERLRPDPVEAEKTLSLENLVDQVSGAVGKKIQDTVKSTLESALPSTPADPIEPAPSGRGSLSQAELIDRIATLFSSHEEVRTALKSDLDATLKNVPRTQAEAALRDWYADLLGQSPDPDPSTDVTADLALRLEHSRR